VSRPANHTSGVRANVGWSVLSKGASVIIKLVAVVTLTRSLGTEDFGILIWVLSTTALLVVFADLGVSGSVARFIAEEPSFSRQLLRRGAIAAGVSTLVIASVLGVFAVPIGGLLGATWLATIWLLVGAALAVQVWLRFLTKAYEGLAQQRVQGRIQLLGGWLPWGLAIAAVALGGGIREVLVGYVVGNTTLAASLSIALWRLLPPDETGQAPSFRSVLSYAAPLIVTAASFYVFTSSDILILQAFAGSADVGVYGAAVRVLDSAQLLSVAVGSGLAVHLVRAARQNHGAEFLQKATQALLSAYLPAGVALFFLAPEFVELAFGDEYAGAALLLQVYLPYFILKSVTPTFSLALDYLGEAGRRAIAIGIAALANVALNFWLIPRWGAVGAAIATQVTYIPVGVWYAWRLTRACGGEWRRWVQSLTPTVVASTLMGAVLMLLKSTFPVGSMMALVVAVPIVCLVYVGVLHLLGGLEPIRQIFRRTTSQRLPA